MPKPDPTITQLEDRLKRLRSTASHFEGVAFRSSTPKYATESDLLSGHGSQQRGGRWNPIGIAVVYASLTPKTAMAETLAHHRYYGVAIEDAMPRTFVAIEATLAIVLDFRDGRVRQRLQVSEDRILAVDWRKEVQAGAKPLTQTIGEAACRSGWEGLIVPSSVDPKGYNLVIIPANLVEKSRLRVVHAESSHA
jgi:RES domain-containing protein